MFTKEENIIKEMKDAYPYNVKKGAKESYLYIKYFDDFRGEPCEIGFEFSSIEELYDMVLNTYSKHKDNLKESLTEIYEKVIEGLKSNRKTFAEIYSINHERKDEILKSGFEFHITLTKPNLHGCNEKSLSSIEENMESSLKCPEEISEVYDVTKIIKKSSSDNNDGFEEGFSEAMIAHANSGAETVVEFANEEDIVLAESLENSVAEEEYPETKIN